MDELDPLLTVLIENPDFNQNDERSEVDRLFERQRAIAGLLDGSTPVDYCLDMLDEHGINPYGWIDSVIANTEWAMSGNLIIPG